MPRTQEQSLLRWGIEHAAPGALAATAQDIKDGKRPDLDPAILRAMMGQSDADKMRECLLVIEGTWIDREGSGEIKNNADITPADRYRAWEDLEMLVEDLDNANDLGNMGMWPPIVAHLTDSDDETVKHACWVCGTAVQNNPQSQQAFLAQDPLPTVQSILTSADASHGTRAKAMYCLSSTLKHSEPAVERFSELEGWRTLTQTLQDPSLKLRAKTAFLLSQLASQVPSTSAFLNHLRSASTLSTLIDALSPSTAVPTGASGSQDAVDPDLRDKGLRFLANLVARTTESNVGPEAEAALESEEKERIRRVVAEAEGTAEWTPEDVGMAVDEWDAFKRQVQ
ncbi:hypothetical protein JCM8202_000773 [Rhodotorula sphaerocarpa]